MFAGVVGGTRQLFCGDDLTREGLQPRLQSDSMKKSQYYDNLNTFSSTHSWAPPELFHFVRIELKSHNMYDDRVERM